MRRVLLELCFIAALAAAATGGAGCGNNGPGATGVAGSGGSSAGSIGTAGAGGGGAVAGGSAVGGGGGAAGAGGSGNATTGTGGTVAQSPEEVHDSLINAQTTGGIEVTRPQPSVMPPACQ